MDIRKLEELLSEAYELGKNNENKEYLRDLLSDLEIK